MPLVGCSIGCWSKSGEKYVHIGFFLSSNSNAASRDATSPHLHGNKSKRQKEEEKASSSREIEK